MSKKIIALPVGFALVLLTIILIPLVFQPQGIQSVPARTSTPLHRLTPGGAVPTPAVVVTIPPVRDLDPKTDYRLKWSFLVRHQNSTIEIFLAPPNMSLADVTKQLGPGDTIVGQAPAPSVMQPPGTPPPVTLPERTSIAPPWFPPPPTRAP